jgi:Phage protein Gp138 N-terminal domain
VIEAFIAAAMVQHFHAYPARVVSYDAAKQTATIEPMVKRVSHGPDDERIVDTLPVLPDVPVEWPRGGGYFLSMPLEAGDGGALWFPDTDIGAWRETGQVVDPGDERLHALGGAVFRPGLETVARALMDASAGHLVIGKDGGPAIHVDASTVQLGAAGGSPLALANASFQAWVTAVSTATSQAAPVGYVATKVKGT